MSRVGRLPIKVGQGVKVVVQGKEVKVEGPKGKLSYELPIGVTIKIDNNVIIVDRDEKASPKAPALHGLARTLIANMVHGVQNQFTRDLEIHGVGYRAAMKGTVLNLTLGYSHPVDYQLPVGITGKVDGNTKISVSGADKCLVGMVAAKIRSFRAPEPYQGKGIRYANEQIVRKEGKAAGAK